MDTSGPEDRVVLLYDGARRFVDLALSAWEAEDREQARVNVGKAQRIFAELSSTLNHEVGGELSRNLEKLYDYWSWRLSQGLLNQESQAFGEVSATLVEMTDTWREAAQQVKVMRGAQAVGRR